MATATVTSKGQITVPASVRADLHLSCGDRIEFVKVEEGRYELVATTQELSGMKGMIKTSKKVSIEEMNQAIKARAEK